jgi:hypothetical protein
MPSSIDSTNLHFQMFTTILRDDFVQTKALERLIRFWDREAARTFRDISFAQYWSRAFSDKTVPTSVDNS